MDLRYVTEEAVLTRTGAYGTPELEQEKKILDALHFHFAKLQVNSLEEVDGYDNIHHVNISHFEMKKTSEGAFFKATYSTVYDDHVGFAMEELSTLDTTHCLSLRVVMHHSDPMDCPWLAQKKREDQRVKFGRELWEQAHLVNETEENWEGDLTCAMQLPGHTTIPTELIEAWQKIDKAYTTDGASLIEDQIEEYEGAMSGGAFVWFEVKGSELPDLLAQLQALSDACSRLGGGWTTEGYLYSDFAVLSFDTDEAGKVSAKYLAV